MRSEKLLSKVSNFPGQDHSLACWQNSICEHHGKPYKGRKCCEQMDGKFRQIESELYNLWPAVGLVNIARSNYSYGVVNSTDKRASGKSMPSACSSVICKKRELYFSMNTHRATIYSHSRT